MNKAVKIILSVVVFVLVLGLLIIGYIAFFTPAGGDTQQGPIGRIIQLFPFGGGGGTTIPQDRDTPPNATSTVPDAQNGKIPRLRMLSEKPVSGARFVRNPRGKSDYVRYVEQESGNIFDVDTRSSFQTRITNTTIPRVRQAVLIGEEGENLLLRYLSNGAIETFLASAPSSRESATSTTPRSLSGTFLPKNIRAIEANDNGALFYITENASTARFILASVDGNNGKEIARSVIGEWIIDWPKAQTLYLTTKASSATLGYVYELNLTTGALEKLMEENLALTTKSNPSGSLLLTSVSERGRTVLGLYDVDEKNYVPLSFSTFPEKCAWSTAEEATVYCAIPSVSPLGNYPDLWYQGVSSFSDSLWRIDVDDGTGELLVNPTEKVGVEIDMWNPVLAPGSDYIIFQNKKDGSLWSYQIIEDN